MAQIVGRMCELCGGRVGTVTEGGFCTACHAPVHRECARRAAKGDGTCAACGAPARPAEPGPPLPKPMRATPKDVRLWGVFAIIFGLGMAFVLGDYEFRPGLPVPWFGFAVVAIGLCMLALPSAFEEHVSRMMRPRSKWIPAPARAASTRAATSMTFEGAYEPPVLTFDQSPFPFRGKGHLAIDAHGLEVSGTRMLSLSRPAAALVVVLIPTVGTVVALTLGVQWLVVPLGIVVACAVLLRRRQRRTTITVPWGNVESFLGDSKGRAVRILVRSMKPSGEIWFSPVEGPSPLLAALLRGAPEEGEDLGL